MVTNRKDFAEHYESDIEFKIKVTLGHILISKVFLYEYFLEYYVNFINEGKFDKTSFLKSVWYIDMMFDWDNYTDRYSRFEEKWNIIAETLKDDTQILHSLKKSIISDIINVIGKRNDTWNLVNPYDMDFLDDFKWIEIVRNWIADYMETEKTKLKDLLWNKKLKKLKNEFIILISDILALESIK